LEITITHKVNKEGLIIYKIKVRVKKNIANMKERKIWKVKKRDIVKKEK
jgi:hypothetical protein